jgi:hypothetical protein
VRCFSNQGKRLEKAPPPSLQEKDKDRERKQFLSLSLTFPFLPSLLELYSNRKTRQKKIVPAV